MSRPKAWTTEYGMAWQPEGATCTIQVQRTATINGRAILMVWASSAGTSVDSPPGIEVVVSPGGRSIRVWDRKTGKEMEVPDE